MTDRYCPVFLAIAILGIMMTNIVFGQSHPTVPGDTLQSVRGVKDPNAMNESWQMPLMAAASDANEKVVKDLIDRKANVNAASMFGMTPLMYANGLPVVKLLLSAGASVKDKDLTGRTALHYAAQQADPDVVRALIKAGASVNARDDKDMSPLDLARLELRSQNFADKSLGDAYKNRVQRVIDLLLASGASPDHP